MNKNNFSTATKLLIAILILFGCILLGYGIGPLSSNSIPGSIIGAGLGLLLIAVTVLLLEFYKIENP
jgi:putative effector of murein hydrolase LrgA (UPF0299 family)